MRLRRGLAPLRNRNYALFWAGFATTRFGRSMEDTGAVWLMYELTGSPILLGLLGISRAAPSILLSPIAGVLADRVDQRRLIFATQLLGLITSLTLGLLVVTGLVEFWHLYIQVAVQAAIEAFDGSVRLALYPRLVPRHQLTEAVTLNSTAGRTSQFLGPAAGGLAIANLGEAAPFLLNAGTFLALMGAVSAMRGIKPRTAAIGSSFRGELLEGMRYIMRAPVLRGLISLEVVIGIFQINPVIITIFARELLGTGPVELGILISAPALGAVVAIFGLVLLGHVRRQGRFVLYCAFAYTASLVAFALAGSFVLAYAALAFIGLCDALMTVTRHSVMQLAAPGHMRGRVMGNMGMVTRGVSPVAETQSGLLTAAMGPVLAVVAAAGALGIAAAITARTNRQLWQFSRTDTVATPPRAAVLPPREESGRT